MEDGLIEFDIERCFIDGRSGPIELGVTTLEELALAVPPALDVRDVEPWEGAPFLCYRFESAVSEIRVFDTDRSGRVMAIHINVPGRQIREWRFADPSRPDAELECDPFRIRLNEQPVESWATLVDAVASGAIEPTRLVALSADASSPNRILNVESRIRGRLLHLSFEPPLVEHRSDHAGRVTFEYCIERVRLFAPDA